MAAKQRGYGAKKRQGTKKVEKFGLNRAADAIYEGEYLLGTSIARPLKA